MNPTPLHPLFAAEVDGPLDTIPVDAFRAAMDRYAVLVVRNARAPTNEEHLAFSRRLGPLQQMKMLTMLANSKSRLPYLELVDVGNLDEQGRILADDDRRRLYNKGNLLWHTDVSFDANRATYSLLAAHQVPPGGAPTEFADMRAAYEALSASKREEIENLVVEHSVWHSRALAGFSEVSEEEKATRPPARHRLVHVRAGRKALYLASHASHVVGWSPEKGRELLADLTRHATQPQFVYRHPWRLGDVVIWDNLATMHRGTPFDDTRHPRDMRRTTVLEA
ncbi:MAG TPA: TauD/TfdA family dioxygenase [Burkholderiales bacterium]|nr:TauD/TfdA family dioxygenase [Burkholderiales bacterium]